MKIHPGGCDGRGGVSDPRRRERGCKTRQGELQRKSGKRLSLHHHRRKQRVDQGSCKERKQNVRTLFDRAGEG